MRTLKRLLALCLCPHLVVSCKTASNTSAVLSDTVEASSTTLEFTGVGDLPISYRIFTKPNARGKMVILSGYRETYLYYDELISDFLSHGYSVYIMDNRGMGESGRPLANKQIVHVEKISDYVDDAEQFVDQIVKPNQSEHVFLFAHSTGGLIGAELLARRPDMFTAAVLSSPLLQLNTGLVPSSLLFSTVSSAVVLGLGQHYGPTYKDYQPSADTFSSCTTTHSEDEFAAGRQIRADHPEILQGGPSNLWIKLVLAETTHVAEFAPKVTTPVLLTQAGEDKFVMPRGQEKFCQLAANCQLMKFAGAYHEIFRETDDIKTPMMEAVFAHFANFDSP